MARPSRLVVRSACWLTLGASLAAAAPAAAETPCEITFELKGWSAFYKTASGEGTVRCANGESARVALKVDGGGWTFGSSTFSGKGKFTGASGIGDVLGGYFRMAAEGGPAGAYVYSKGPVHLAVSGTGRGFTVGVDFGRLLIKRR
jgi:hypothetical protein